MTILGQGTQQPPESTGSTGGTQSSPQPITIDKWRDVIPEEFKTEKMFESVPDLPTLIKNYVHAQKAMGADKIVVPAKTATEDDWRNVFRKLGTPEAPDKYELKFDEKKMNKEFIDVAKDFAFKNHMTPKQAQGFVDWFNTFQEQQTDKFRGSMEEQKGKWLTDLKTEYGMAFDTKLKKAQAAVKHFDKDGKLTEFLDATGMGDRPEMIRLFANLGEGLGESHFVDNSGMGFAYTPDMSKQAVNAIMADKKHAYFDKANPGHNAAVQEVNKHFKNMSGM